MPPIRLAYFIDSLAVGGSELNAIRTLEGLDRSRFDLTVFHLAAEGPLKPRYAALGVPLVRVALRGIKHPSALPAGWRFRSELRRRGIQILHSHDIYSNIFSIPWARAAGVPVIIASKRWLDDVPTRSYGSASPMNVLANRLASRLATRVLANSSAVARSLIEADGIAEARVEVIPNFVGSGAFADPPPGFRRAVLGPLGVPDDALVIGVVARLAPVKDHALLLRAVGALRPLPSNLHLVFIGEGPSRAELVRMAQELGLTERVHFTGTLPNTPNPHGLLDISVLPSWTEGFPNAVVEAMAAERPVVATSVGGTPEAVLAGETGLLIPRGDAAELARALQSLLDSPDRRRTLGVAGRVRAREVYLERAVLERLSDWYARLVGET